jgi:hypothetical protein
MLHVEAAVSAAVTIAQNVLSRLSLAMRNDLQASYLHANGVLSLMNVEWSS